MAVRRLSVPGGFRVCKRGSRRWQPALISKIIGMGPSRVVGAALSPHPVILARCWSRTSDLELVRVGEEWLSQRRLRRLRREGSSADSGGRGQPRVAPKIMPSR
jgi:hypothetical protein